MNIFTKAIDTIKHTIPMEVLRIAFKDDVVNYNQAPMSLDAQILNKILRPRVLNDMDIVGGQSMMISLEGVSPQYADNFTIIYEIPAEKAGYRSILSILSISYLPYSTTYNALGLGMGTVNPQSMNDLLSAGQRVFDSVSNVPPISNATCDLIGYNTILIRDQLRVTNAYQLRCIVGNEENLMNINPRSYLNFAKLCVLAVKSYIYNKLIVAIDSAYLTGGQELGSIKTIIESYADAEEMYETYLNEVWAPVAFMNDSNEYERFIRLQLSPGL